jgi:polysaccharide export outer membrane protein
MINFGTMSRFSLVVVRIASVVLCCFIITGCDVSKRIVYFQNDIPKTLGTDSYSPILRKDDLLSILVIGQDAEASKPFNLPMVEQRSMGGYYQGVSSQNGYLIDANGIIDFPVIGALKLEGLNKQEAIDFIKSKLLNYLNNPTVIIRILNYKVTVLGEVKTPGTFTIPNDRVTLLDAIGIAGDLLITGSRTDVLVLREQKGEMIEYRIDLTQSDVLNSPVFYLQQNDVVYVAPNRAKQNSSVISYGNASLALSGISILLTIFLLFK